MERKRRNNDGDNPTFDSVKERFLLKKKNVDAYLRGKWSTAQANRRKVQEGNLSQQQMEKMERVSRSIQEEITSKKLRAAVRTVCRRTAFQAGRDQTLRFSIDTNLHMIDEIAGQEQFFRNCDNAIPINGEFR